MVITQDITIRGLSPEQVKDVMNLIQSFERTGDVARTAGELVAAIAQDAPLTGEVMPQNIHPVLHPGGSYIPGHVGNAVSAMPPAQPAAPAAAPTSGTTAATASEAPRDSRGVPFHPNFHGAGERKADGTWKRRRNHDKAAADAYEAPYLQPQRQAEAAALGNAVPTASPTASPVAASTPVGAVSGVTVDPTAVFGAPLAPPPPPAYEPVEVLDRLWADLAAAGRVGDAHRDTLTGWHQSGTVVGSQVYRNDPVKRQEAINWLRQHCVPQPAA